MIRLLLTKMDSVGISKGKQRRSVEKTIADSVEKLNEYDRHLVLTLSRLWPMARTAAMSIGQRSSTEKSLPRSICS